MYTLKPRSLLARKNRGCFQRSGKGFRDIDGAREADDWRSNGPRKGKGALVNVRKRKGLIWSKWYIYIYMYIPYIPINWIIPHVVWFWKLQRFCSDYVYFPARWSGAIFNLGTLQNLRVLARRRTIFSNWGAGIHKSFKNGGRTWKIRESSKACLNILLRWIQMVRKSMVWGLIWERCFFL